MFTKTVEMKIDKTNIGRIEEQVYTTKSIHSISSYQYYSKCMFISLGYKYTS